MKLSDFFYLNRSDRGVLMFFLAVGLIAFSLIFYMGGEEKVTAVSAEDSLEVQKSPFSSRRSAYEEANYDAGETRAERFAFDPNTADSTAFLRLGLQPWQVRNIYKYRAAGGIYRRPADFARLYGLTQKQYRELEPFIRIGTDYAPAADFVAEERHEQRDTTRSYTPKLRPTERIDLNLSDTTALKKVPGIGSYYARQIDRYRTRLGGFYSVDQLKEIDDFPVEAAKYFVVSDNIHRMNLNTMKLNELKRHPYLNYYQAKAITDYRRLHGELKSLNDLRLCKEFTPADIERLSHYVCF